MKNGSFKFFLLLLLLMWVPNGWSAWRGTFWRELERKLCPSPRTFHQQHGGSSYMIQLSSSFLWEAWTTVGREEFSLSFLTVKMNWFDCLLKPRTTRGTHLDLAMEVAGWCWGEGSCQPPGQGHSLAALLVVVHTQAGRAEPSLSKQKSKKWMAFVKERNGNVF